MAFSCYLISRFCCCCWRGLLVALAVLIMASSCCRTAVAFSLNRGRATFIGGGIRNVQLCSRQNQLPRTRLGLFPSFSSSSSQKNNNHNNGNDPSRTAPLKDFISFPAYQLSTPPPDVMQNLRPGQRVVCIGDVHGDYPALVEFLTIAQVMDPNTLQWIGGDTICVQLGDVLDRGYHELACFELLAQLSRQASMHGGALQILYGNHEALNAVGLFQYAVSDDEFEDVLGKPVDLIMNSSFNTTNWRHQFAGNSPVRWAAFEPGGLLSDVLCKHLKVGIVVGKTVCIHAGLTRQHLEKYGGIAGMNQQARDWMTHQCHARNNNDGYYSTADEIRQDAQARANAASAAMPECLGGGIGSHSPVWMRDFSQPNDSPPSHPKAQQMINAVLEELNCDRMVMGHTPQFKINCALQGKAWRIDVGASQGVMGGTPEVLEIVHSPNGGEDQVNVLTRTGKVPAVERQTVESGILF